MKLNVEKAPFLTQRLKIRVIPTLALVIDGKTKVHQFDHFDSLPVQLYSTAVCQPISVQRFNHCLIGAATVTG